MKREKEKEDMGKQSIENQILDTIEIVADKMVKQAGYDKTISATVSKLVSPVDGKYLVKYQDSSFYAYSTNTDVSYTSGTNVYVQVHNGDMSSDKTIIGAVKNFGVDYAQNLDSNDHYEEIGISCISENSFDLSSYTTKRINIYTKDGKSNKVIVKDNDLKQYLKSANSLLCEASFKTELPKEQQYGGSYGVIYTLTFDTPSGTVDREYRVDINNIEGMPYRVLVFSPTQAHYEIDGKNFKYVKSIDIFVENFPQQAEGKAPDIFIKDIKIIAEKKISSNLLKGYFLTIETPRGAIFSKEEPSEITLKPLVKFNGKVVENATQNVKFFWFVENMEVNSGDKQNRYNYHGGEGWQYLPKFSNICTIKKEDILADEISYKCVAFYEDLNLELKKEIIVYNKDSKFKIDIQKNTSQGYTDLFCNVSNANGGNYTYEYVWGYNDYKGNYHQENTTVQANLDYNRDKQRYDSIKKAIADGAYEVSWDQILKDLEKTLNEYGGFGKTPSIKRVENNAIYGINNESIVNFNEYRCSVFTKINNQKVYLGTARTSVENDIASNNKATIALLNSSQVFKYNEDGISPNSNQVERKQNIVGLMVDIYYNGEKVADNIMERLTYRWEVPAADTMLEIPKEYDGYKKSVDPITNITTYEGNLRSFSYRISEKYDINKDHNDIRVFVSYKNELLTEQTNFLFIKEGALGTNGTKYVCKIVPRTTQQIPWVPILSNKPVYGSLEPPKHQLNYPIMNSVDITDLTQPWFNLQLWEDGELIFNNYSSGKSSQGDDVVLVWSLQGGKNYPSTLKQTSSRCVFDWDSDNVENQCNIIKCAITYKGHSYYATIPIVTMNTLLGYKIDFIEHSGFLSAEYSAQADNPKYDNNEPFTFRILKEVGNAYEDITNNKNFDFTYEWKILGSIYNPIDKVWKSSINLIEVINDKIEKNSKYFKPVSRFNGECLNNAIQCIIKDKGKQISKIHIPIMMYLNRYANTAINGWDGNSVSIDKLGNGSIFAPQIGAGRKEADNSFSGLLMGEVKEGGQNNSKLGLVGYYQGQQDLYISAYNGYAIFGKQGPGQIVLDPSSNQAMLYSGNFWKEYNNSSTPEKDGLPKTTYAFDERTNKYNNQSDEGMLLDLTNSRIIFGNGNFLVDEKGNLTAKGKGNIAGWQINSYQFYKEVAASGSDQGISVGMNSVSTGTTGAKIHNVPYPGTKIIKKEKNLAFWTGTKNTPKFYATHDGYLVAEEAAIGSGREQIFIGNHNNNSAIFTNDKFSIDSSGNGFYLGTNGFALGGVHTIVDEKVVSRFQVDPDGTFYARSGYIGSSTSGWRVRDKSFDNGGRTDYNDTAHKGVYLGTDGISLGQKSTTVIENGKEVSTNIIPFYVDKNGSLYSVQGQIANWTINESALSMKNGDFEISIGKSGIYFGDVFSVDNMGKMRAIDGTIAGWKITANALKSDPSTTGDLAIEIGSAGSIKCGDRWSINNDGTANFKNINVTGGSIKINGVEIKDKKDDEDVGAGNSFTGSSFSTPGGYSFSDGGMKKQDKNIFNLEGEFFVPITVKNGGGDSSTVAQGDIVLYRDGIGTAYTWKSHSIRTEEIVVGSNKGASADYFGVSSDSLKCKVAATFNSTSKFNGAVTIGDAAEKTEGTEGSKATGSLTVNGSTVTDTLTVKEGLTCNDASATFKSLTILNNAEVKGTLTTDSLSVGKPIGSLKVGNLDVGTETVSSSLLVGDVVGSKVRLTPGSIDLYNPHCEFSVLVSGEGGTTGTINIQAPTIRIGDNDTHQNTLVIQNGQISINDKPLDEIIESKIPNTK